MEKSEIKGFIAKRITQKPKDGDMANLGIGPPTLVSAYLPEEVHVILQSKNSIIDTGAKPMPEEADPRYKIGTGGQSTQAIPFGCYIDSATLFDFIRGSHINVTILDGLGVDGKGFLSNWTVPGKKVPDMDGAMDPPVGAKEVIVAMEHTAKDNPRILKKCRLPYTTVHCVTKTTTEMCVISMTDKGLEPVEINSEFTVEQVQAATEAILIVSPNLRPMH